MYVHLHQKVSDNVHFHAHTRKWATTSPEILTSPDISVGFPEARINDRGAALAFKKLPFMI